ncbi:MAG: hypothetical protein V3T87_00375, partial [Candidatus Thorarchaeota archaeon]
EFLCDAPLFNIHQDGARGVTLGAYFLNPSTYTQILRPAVTAFLKPLPGQRSAQYTMAIFAHV